MAKERDLNIELLRVICMVFVVLFHVNLNVILRNPDTSDFLNYCAIAGNALVAVAVDCFVLISGYFGIKWKSRSFLGLFFQIEFYSGLLDISLFPSISKCLSITSTVHGLSNDGSIHSSVS